MAKTKQTARKQAGVHNSQTTPATFPLQPATEMAGDKKDKTPTSAKKETERCKICRAKVSKRSMSRHMKEQHSNTTQCYQCSNCLLYSKRSAQIKQHLLKKHGVSDVEPERMIVSTNHFKQNQLKRSRQPSEPATAAALPVASNLSDTSTDSDSEGGAGSVVARSVDSEDSVASNTRAARKRQLSAQADMATTSQPVTAQKLFDTSSSDSEPVPLPSKSSSHTSLKSTSRSQAGPVLMLPAIEPVAMWSTQPDPSTGARPKQPSVPETKPEATPAPKKERARDRTRREEHSHSREEDRSGSQVPGFRERSVSRDTKTTDSAEYLRDAPTPQPETKAAEKPEQTQALEAAQVTPSTAGAPSAEPPLVSPAELHELLETYRKYKVPKPTEKPTGKPKQKGPVTTTVTTVTPLTFPLTLHVTAPTATTSRIRSRSQDSDSTPASRKSSLSAEWTKPDVGRAKRQCLAGTSAGGTYDPRDIACQPGAYRAPPEATLRRASLSELQSESDPFLTPTTPAPAVEPVPAPSSTLPAQPEGPTVFSRVNLGHGVQRDIIRPDIRDAPAPNIVRHGLDQLGPVEYRDDGVYVLIPQFHSSVTGFSVSTQVCRVENMDITDERLRHGFTVLPQWGLYPQAERVRHVMGRRTDGPPTGDAQDLYRPQGPTWPGGH